MLFDDDVAVCISDVPWKWDLGVGYHSVIEEALRTSNPSTAVAFFYCDYKDPATQGFSNILGSLPQQFAK